MVWKKILQKNGFNIGLPAVGRHQLHMMLLMVSSLPFYDFWFSEESNMLPS